MFSDKQYISNLTQRIYDELEIDDLRFVEIESKKRVVPEQAKALKKYLQKKRGVEHVKSAFFLDQFLDTPDMDIFNVGGSLRLRYKRNATQVYLQYKGPGFREDGLLYRSEFSSRRLTQMTMEESHHDVIHFTKTSISSILKRNVPKAMANAMRLHLGARAVSRITIAPIICVYQKDKFKVKTGNAFLEPSLDRLFAFHINKGLHPLSTFWEYENEIKAASESLHAKLLHLPELLKFDTDLCKKFDLKTEPLDKYHRCTTIFQPTRARNHRR